MTSKYFYHGLKEGIDDYDFLFDKIDCVEKMITIIESGGLKCRRLLKSRLTGGYNGDDYVSLCRKEENEKYREYPSSSFYTYIHDNFCFIISDEVDAIKTEYLNRYDFNNVLDIQDYIIEHEPERFSDMFDEWQVKDEIPLKYIVGIGVPLKTVKSLRKFDSEHEKLVDKLFLLANSLGLDIVDTRSSDFIEEYESSKSEGKNKVLVNSLFNE